MKLYHVSPRYNRESILELGLLPLNHACLRGNGNYKVILVGLKGIYLTNRQKLIDLIAAVLIDDFSSKVDVWEVTIKCVLKDPIFKEDSYFTPTKIPPSKLRLVKTIANLPIPYNMRKDWMIGYRKGLLQ